MSVKDLSLVPVAVAPSPATSGTTLKVLLTDINSGPSSAPIVPTGYPFFATIAPSSGLPTRANSEIIKVTAASDDATYRTYTITRSQGVPGTTARSIAAGDYMFVGFGAQNWLDQIKYNWVPVLDTWTYASSKTITVPTGAGSEYRQGGFLRFKQGGGYKYMQIDTLADTLLTVAGGSDYSVANSAITDVYYSNIRPVDFPGYFNLTATNFTTSGTSFTNQPTLDILHMSMEGKIVKLHGLFHTHATSGGTGSIYINVTSGLLITIAANTSVGYALNLSSKSSNGPVLMDTTQQNRIELIKYDNTVIAGNGQYVDFTVWYER